MLFSVFILQGSTEFHESVNLFVSSNLKKILVIVYFILFFKFYLFIYFLAAWGLRCCARTFYSCAKQGLLFVAVHRLLIMAASLVAEHGL